MATSTTPANIIREVIENNYVQSTERIGALAKNLEELENDPPITGKL